MKVRAVSLLSSCLGIFRDRCGGQFVSDRERLGEACCTVKPALPRKNTAGVVAEEPPI